MTQPTGELKRSVKWIVPISHSEGGTFGRPSLCAACRGNEDIGVVLNYFTFEASLQAEREKTDLASVEYITLERGLDEILKGIKPSRTSKKTLIGYHHKLQEWGFVVSHGYKQKYDVYFRKIAEAIANPPPQEKRKPRGRHVSKLQSLQSQEDCNSNCLLELQSTDVKTTISELKGTILEDGSFEELLKLPSEFLNLQSEIVTLQSKFLVLQSQMVALQSLQSSEGTSRQAASYRPGNSRLIDCNRLLETKEIVSVAANADTTLSQFSSFQEELDVGEYATQVSLINFLEQRGIDTKSRYGTLEQLSPFSEQASTDVDKQGASNDTASYHGRNNRGTIGSDRDTPIIENCQETGLDVVTPVSSGGDTPPSSAPSQPLATQPVVPLAQERDVTEALPSQSPRIDSQREREASVNAPDYNGDKQAEGISYSHRDSTKPEEAAKRETPPPKRSRKPPKPKIDAAMQERIDHTCQFFDTLAQEITGVIDYHYTPSKKDIDEIIAWLKNHPTEEILREVYTQLWNTPVDPKTGFDWKQNMYIHSVLKQYATRSLPIKAKLAKRKEAKNIVQNMSVFPVPEEPDLPSAFVPSSVRRQQQQQKASGQ